MTGHLDNDLAAGYERLSILPVHANNMTESVVYEHSLTYTSTHQFHISRIRDVWNYLDILWLFGSPCAAHKYRQFTDCGLEEAGLHRRPHAGYPRVHCTESAPLSTAEPPQSAMLTVAPLTSGNNTMPTMRSTRPEHLEVSKPRPGRDGGYEVQSDRQEPRSHAKNNDRSHRVDGRDYYHSVRTLRRRAEGVKQRRFISPKPQQE